MNGVTTVPLSPRWSLRNSTTRADAGVLRKDVKTLCSFTGTRLGLHRGCLWSPWVPLGRLIATERQGEGLRSREASLTGEVASQEVTEACDGTRSDHGRRNGGACLTARQPCPAGARVLLSGRVRPVVVICRGRPLHLTNQSYARDNRLIPRRSPNPAGGLAPRCRLSPSSRRRRWEGSDCSSVEGLRELG